MDVHTLAHACVQDDAPNVAGNLPYEFYLPVFRERKPTSSKADNVTDFSLLKVNRQKQPSRGVLWKRCSENMKQIYRRTHPCRNAISVKLQSNFIQITLRHGCSPVN